MAKAWLAVPGVDASRTAPAGKSNVSPCQWKAVKTAGKPSKRRSLRGSVNRKPSDLFLSPGVNLRAQRLRDHLRAKADTEHGLAGPDRLGHKRDFGIEPSITLPSLTLIGPPMTASISNAGKSGKCSPR